MRDDHVFYPANAMLELAYSVKQRGDGKVAAKKQQANAVALKDVCEVFHEYLALILVVAFLQVAFATLGGESLILLMTA
ncbi:hypothetical protein [Polaromonas jejuensis]|uniref:Uncharacterized protein n=1 Tax=Polaromonas jejuensis TaxID=457502 RepID=A0ABW0Q3D5_9BURK|nr:hypothetical protein [Polaromonas jejuensis]